MGLVYFIKCKILYSVLHVPFFKFDICIFLQKTQQILLIEYIKLENFNVSFHCLRTTFFVARVQLYSFMEARIFHDQVPGGPVANGQSIRLPVTNVTLVRFQDVTCVQFFYSYEFIWTNFQISTSLCNLIVVAVVRR